VTAPDPILAAFDLLAAFVARRVVDALRPELAASAKPSTAAQRLTLDDLAHAESCSRATIRRLVRDGAPVHYVGSSPRFELDAWRAWCAARGRQGATAAPSKRRTVVGVRLLSRG
jgi:hypothetical protein